MRQSIRALTGIGLAVTALSGCMQDMGGDTVSRFLQVQPEVASGPTDAAVAMPGEAPSTIITDLMARRSVLEDGSPYDTVAMAVLAADARVAEAELQVAQLRAQAASKNWWPTISPTVSLTALGDAIADMVINQVLFDNGRKKAERDLAKADVELAAVGLSESSNDRVFDGLVLYLQAEEGREAATLYEQALKDMSHFEWVMDERVKGGVSDFSDLNIVRQKLADLRARDSAAKEQTTRAIGALNAMSDTPLEGVRGVRAIGGTPQTSALTVVRAVVELDRQIAQAKIQRSQNLPGLSVGGSVRDRGENISLTGGIDNALGLGTPDTLKAIEATKVTADRKVSEAEELAARDIESDQREIAALERQTAEATDLTRQAKQNLDLFQRQYEAGTRQVMDVVGVYETFLRSLEKELELKYRAARAELNAAKRLGVLADGARI